MTDEGGKKFSHGSLQAGCVKSRISCTCVITASKHAHLFFMFAGAKVSQVQHGKNTYQENECVAVCMSVRFYVGLTAVLLRSVGASQNQQEVLHVASSVPM